MCGIQLFHILDANDCAGDRVCESCMQDLLEDFELQEGERVVKSGCGCCAHCGEGEWEE